MNRFDECKKAYADYPSQDNEGYTPDRAGFKCGFSAAWRLKEKEMEQLRVRVKELEESHCGKRNRSMLFGWTKEAKTIIARLKNG
jgi:hypothetical protein